jgi:NDP-sugar pyrophosphorylase family protein
MKDTDVIILCGGLGKRLRPVVSDRPKSLARINKTAFLDILIGYLLSFGFKRFILCCGYMGDLIREHYNKASCASKIVFSQETKLLGTGGALKNSRRLIRSNPFLVLNGDSFLKLNLRNFYKFHLQKNAILSIALSSPKPDQNSGVVTLDNKKRIIEFNEKIKPARKTYCSAGIYFMDQKIFKFMGKRKVFSLEYDLFPTLTNKYSYGYYCKNSFIDIGTPQNLMKAEEFLKHV